MTQRSTLILGATLMTVLFGTFVSRPDPLPYSKRTFVYKQVGQCKIHLTAYRSPGEEVRPVVLWIHGGALIAGHRSNISSDQLKGYLDSGFVVVAIDYRLAPETKLADIIQDVRDAAKWLRSEPARGLKIDPARLAVVGHSAGGYLTLMAGFCLDQRPKALVAFYGYGDIATEWYSRPDSFYNQSEPAVPKEEAYQAVDGPPISEGSNHRFEFYLYCRQQGLWPQEVAGHDPAKEPRAFEPFCPIRNVTKDYPPTMLLHGDKDTDVPYQQSVDMAEALKRSNVECVFVTVKNGGHGFDSARGGLKDPENAERFQRVLQFLKTHL
jgi:acetyl esterase/lipase